MLAETVGEVDLVLEDLERIVVHLLDRLRTAVAGARSGVGLRVEVDLGREKVDDTGELDAHKLAVVA